MILWGKKCSMGGFCVSVSLPSGGSWIVLWLVYWQGNTVYTTLYSEVLYWTVQYSKEKTVCKLQSTVYEEKIQIIHNFAQWRWCRTSQLGCQEPLGMLRRLLLAVLYCTVQYRNCIVQYSTVAVLYCTATVLYCTATVTKFGAISKAISLFLVCQLVSQIT